MTASLFYHHCPFPSHLRRQVSRFVFCVMHFRKGNRPGFRFSTEWQPLESQRAKVKIQNYNSKFKRRDKAWIPFFNGMTAGKGQGLDSVLRRNDTSPLCHPRESGDPGPHFVFRVPCSAFCALSPNPGSQPTLGQAWIPSSDGMTAKGKGIDLDSVLRRNDSRGRFGMTAREGQNPISINQ